jgi:hypothetical protein
MSMGFTPVKGSYDYVYNWGNNVNTDEIVNFGDKVQVTLKDTGVMFKIETVNGT